MKYLRIFMLIVMVSTGLLFPATSIAFTKGQATPSSKGLSTPSPRGKVSILIDVQRRTLTILEDHSVYKKYRVAVGREDSPSPIGNWKILRLAKDWGSGFGSRFMLLNVPWGIYGIHGTNKPYSIGGFESHGCIRMHDRDVEEIYPWIKVGTQVIITGNPFGRLNQPWKTSFKGHKGSDIVLIQLRLQYWGLYQGRCDGIFGWSTEAALKKFQQKYGLPLTGQVDEDDYRALGL